MRTLLARWLPSLCAAGFALTPLAAYCNGNEAALQAELQRLAARLDRLESRNHELEQQLAERAAEAPALSRRVEALEATQAQVEQSLSSERVSENEPELVTRVKAVEFQTLSMQKQVRQIEALDGVTVSASLTSVIQHANRRAAQPEDHNARASYRGDIAVTLPGGEMGDVDGRIFLHARFGQGDGVGLRPTYTSTPNSTGFRVADAVADDAHVMIAQAWYQLNVPLPRDGIKAQSHDKLSLTFGKIDPFAFFDQNAIADDETVRFLDNAFVHNPLLDSGGDVGSDAYGFSPGMVLRYANDHEKASPWSLSLGIFGSGEGARFSGSPGKPFLIAQAETAYRFAGLPGNYRAYLWSNGRASDFDGAEARHSGLGVSIDQRITDSLTVFGRYGHQLAGKVRFDRALTTGFEWDGSDWGRGSDALGGALGFLRTANAFRAGSATVDADADGLPDYGYAASGWERLAELYYRVRINNRFELSPDFQFIQRPGGDASAASIVLIGLRARVGF